MLSLNDLRSPAAGLDWHEAVAVGAALGTLLAEAKAPACPRPADVTLLPSGDLRVTGSGHVEGSAAACVAHLLGQLLEAAPHPAELRQLVEAYAADRRSGAAGVEAVTEFVSELAFFERPGRRDVLSAVALRAEPAIERANRAAALEALTERTRLAAAAAPAPVAVVPARTRVEGDEGPRDWDPPHDGGARPAARPGGGRGDRLPARRLRRDGVARSAGAADAARRGDRGGSADLGAGRGLAPPAAAPGAPRPQRSAVPSRERPSGGSVSAPPAADARSRPPRIRATTATPAAPRRRGRST